MTRWATGKPKRWKWNWRLVEGRAKGQKLLKATIGLKLTSINVSVDCISFLYSFSWMSFTVISIDDEMWLMMQWIIFCKIQLLPFKYVLKRVLLGKFEYVYTLSLGLKLNCIFSSINEHWYKIHPRKYSIVNWNLGAVFGLTGRVDFPLLVLPFLPLILFFHSSLPGIPIPPTPQ